MKKTLLLILSLAFALIVSAQPANYYNSANGLQTTVEGGIVTIQSTTEMQSKGVFGINANGEVILQMYDKNGNSDVTRALLMILMDRYKVKYGSTDVNTITKRISQYPITPQEAIIRSQGNMFPVTELNERLNQLDNNPTEYEDVYVGNLVQRDGKVEFENSTDIPIRDFPTKDNKVTGCLEIYEMP